MPTATTRVPIGFTVRSKAPAETWRRWHIVLSSAAFALVVAGCSTPSCPEPPGTVAAREGGSEGESSVPRYRQDIGKAQTAGYYATRLEESVAFLEEEDAYRLQGAREDGVVATVRALSWAGISAVPVLLEAAKDGDWRVRLEATEALGSVRPRIRTAQEGLVECLHDPEWAVRWEAAAAVLERDEHPAALSVLAEALDQEDSTVAGEAAIDLAFHADGMPGAGSALLRGLDHHEVQVRMETIAALGLLDQATPDVLLALRRTLRCGPQQESVEAAAARGGLGARSAGVEATLEAALPSERRHRVRVTLIAALGNIVGETRRVSPALIACVTAGSPEERSTAIYALQGVGAGDPEVRAALDRATKGPNHAVRRAAWKELQTFEETSERPPPGER
jgi:HEAT repeat protein